MSALYDFKLLILNNDVPSAPRGPADLKLEDGLHPFARALDEAIVKGVKVFLYRIYAFDRHQAPNKHGFRTIHAKQWNTF